ncbi:MAG: histidinol dehydrogenase [Flavobacteriaceae bacterium]|nr:histidinol dehydrogenase [Flavobacteriaceae bacterium]
MKRYKNPSKNKWRDLCQRPLVQLDTIQSTVKKVFDEVEKHGDKAVKQYTQQFDGVALGAIEVTQDEIKLASDKISNELKNAIDLAKSNITKFHRVQRNNKTQVITTTQGVDCWLEHRPIEKVGIYIPGGSAPLFSTVMMLAIPAIMAGCQEVVLCSPPDQYGNLSDVILYTAQCCDIHKIYKVGGIQAIASMALGTETVPKVDKIFGPGNQYVTAAKQYLQHYQVAIDLPAGPSEVLVIADQSANPVFVASDLLAQAEHGHDSQVVLLSDDMDFIENVFEKVKKQTQHLHRKDIIEKSLKNGMTIHFPDLNDAIEFSNIYAPEHLIIATENADYLCQKITNAGSVFIGPYSPESIGDYASGTNHTLPTNGWARQCSGVTVQSFQKTISFQKISEKGLYHIGPSVELLADAEGLDAHKNAVSVRLDHMKSKNLIS